MAAYSIDLLRQGCVEEEKTIVLRAHALRRSEGSRPYSAGAASYLDLYSLLLKVGKNLPLRAVYFREYATLSAW